MSIHPVSRLIAVVTVALIAFVAREVTLPDAHAQSTTEKLSSRQIKKLAGWKSYEKLCAACHGKKGDGRGPVGKFMTPEPTNFWNCDALGAVSDEEIQTVILDGSAAIGKSNAMQGFKRKIKSAAQVNELIQVIRSFEGCAYTK